MSILSVKDLSFDYPDKSILHRLTFSIDKGDFLCIAGTNGTGKSTLLKLILNILRPLEGSISLLGKSSVNFSEYDKIAYVSQKATSFNRDFPATVEEIVSLGLYKKNSFFKRESKKEREQKIDEVLKKVGLTEYKKKKVGLLSGGQQQRVFIAKALISQPEIIFLDEPTVGIDVSAVDSICCLLGDLNKAGLTIVMVTHDISSVLYHSTKILILNEAGGGKLMDSEKFNSKPIFAHFSHGGHNA
ncbi:MAG: metal ABC transporter ATP-binding protein [Firmicutes bacterium]|nr:metal ABC transporter ATP-binding protein [Bacillota bacterium]